jgi:hypothetical protein
MISKKYKFIYIHIPKTGGNSIQAALEPYSDDKLVFRKSIGNVIGEDGRQGLDVFNPELGFNEASSKHATINDYYSVLGDAIHSYFIFTSIRNPWDRVISQTSFLSQNTLPVKPIDFSDLKLPNRMIDYISIDGAVLVNGLIRFESMQIDFNNVCEHLEIMPVSLPHKNRSSRIEYCNYYDDKSRKYVEEMFKSDINAFGYEFNDNKAVNG